MTIDEYQEAKERKIEKLQNLASEAVKNVRMEQRRLDDILNELRDVKMDVLKQNCARLKKEYL